MGATVLPDVSGLVSVTAAAAAAVNKHLISLMFERFHLLDHLRALKRFMLLAEVCLHPVDATVHLRSVAHCVGRLWGSLVSTGTCVGLLFLPLLPTPPPSLH